MNSLVTYFIIGAGFFIVGVVFTYLYLEIRLDKKAKQAVEQETMEVFKDYNLIMHETINKEMSEQMKEKILDGKFLIGKNINLVLKQTISEDSAVFEIKFVD